MKNSQIFVYLSAIAFGVFLMHTMVSRRKYTGCLALGTAFIIYALTSDLTMSFVGGAVVGIIAEKSRYEGFANEDDDDEPAEEEEEKEIEVPKKKAGKKKVLPPNNGERAEFLELGKKYKAPSEDDDKDFHLDAGTTFMNAYKSLKPDQVAAMTKDTQDLMQTQKQLMNTLHTLKPLIKDGKEMMNVFQSYFGAGEPTTV